MSVPLTGVGGFFVRQGCFVGEFNRVAAFYGSDLTNGFQSIWAQFASSDQQAVENLPSAVLSFSQSASQYESVLIGDGSQAMLLQTRDDTSVVPFTTQRAIQIVAGQMKTAVQSIQRATLGSTLTANPTNFSDATIVISTVNQFGDSLDMTVAETITITCTGTSTVFQEQLQAIGEAVLVQVDPNWPGGSGANLSFNIVDPAASGLTTNGGFAAASWTGDTPGSWTIIDGAAGVTVLRVVSGGLRTGTDACRLVSDGAQATQIAQNLSLAINTVYLFSVNAKVSASDGSGTLIIQLTDGDGNVLTDDAGNSLTYSRDMSTQVTTNYQNFTVAFATPRILPSVVRIEVGFGVPPTAAKTMTLDLVGAIQGQQLYMGGPFIAAFANIEATAVDDNWSLVVTNSLTTKSFALGMDRLYNMRGMQVYFPSANSPTVSDSLVTH